MADRKPASGSVIKAPYVGRLATVADWAKEIGRVYRQMRKGEIDTSDGTKLTYVANVGAQLAKIEQELKELEVLRKEIERLQGGGAYASGNGHGTTDFLPAQTENANPLIDGESS